MTDNLTGSFLRKHKQRRSGKALTIPLKGKVVSETPSTVTTAAGAVYRQSDIARSKLPVQSRIEGSEKKRSPTGEEPRSKQQKTVTQDEDGDSESAEEHDVKDQGPRDQEIEDSWLMDKFQNSPSIVTSKDTKTGGGINLGGKRNKPNRAGPFVHNPRSYQSMSTTQELRKPKAAKTATKGSKKRVTSNEEVYIESSAPKEASVSKPSIITFQNKNMKSKEWEALSNQVLTRGVQKEAEKLLTQQAGPADTFPHQGFLTSQIKKRRKRQLEGVIDKRRTRGQRDMVAQYPIRSNLSVVRTMSRR